MGFLDLSLIFDLVLVLIVGYFIFRGTRKGILSYFYSLFALVAAYPLACFIFPFLLSFLPRDVAQRMQGDVIAFGTVLVVLYLVIIALCWVLFSALNRLVEDFPDKLAGGILGLIKGLAIISIIILLAMTFTYFKTGMFKDSYLTHLASHTVEYLSKPLPRQLKEKFIQRREKLEQQRGKAPLAPDQFNKTP